jgi:hypothetical protein
MEQIIWTYAVSETISEKKKKNDRRSSLHNTYCRDEETLEQASVFVY